MPDELSVQIERIKQVVRALNIPILELEGYEADDVLGTVAGQVRGQVPVYIITGDRDLLQLVDDNTRVELPSRRPGQPGEVYDAEGVVGYLGVRPDQMVDYKALVGDISDNIPGVKGIGEKTAVKLLAEYGTLANLYAHLDDIKGALRQKLADGRPAADLSYQLARTHRRTHHHQLAGVPDARFRRRAGAGPFPRTGVPLPVQIPHGRAGCRRRGRAGGRGAGLAADTGGHRPRRGGAGGDAPGIGQRQVDQLRPGDG